MIGCHYGARQVISNYLLIRYHLYVIVIYSENKYKNIVKVLVRQLRQMSYPIV